MEKSGVIYILTNPSFPQYVKIGYATDVKQRLYELEEQLAGTRFVRVSHSEIINLDKVTALDLSLSGTIRVTLAGGVTAYASRRYVKKLKQAAGIVR